MKRITQYFCILFFVSTILFLSFNSLKKSPQSESQWVQPTLQASPSILPSPPVIQTGIQFDGIGQVYKNHFFTMTVIENEQSIQNFKIAYEGSTDNITDPKLSPNKTFGCVTVGASGYSGYYIFSLPDGKPIARGKQYSSCLKWIDNNQVILEEHIYNTNVYSTYVFNSDTKIKKLLGSYIGAY